MSAAAPLGRAVTRVAVGVLISDDGSVLMADRPAGKPYAGYWEFPGGKIEAGEDVAAALERELHEELGVDIGASAPWVTFEFDYPHAYVELQFRRIRQWHGEPHAREGQQLRFVDPRGDLPQPLLPAAVPVLRWLLLPRTALVSSLQDASALAAAIGQARRACATAEAPMVVVDADWRAADSAPKLSLLRRQAGATVLLLAAGPGAQQIAEADGYMLSGGDFGKGDRPTGRLRGAWVDSAAQLQRAADAGCDLVLVGSAALAEALRLHAASLPVYFPSAGIAVAQVESPPWPGQGRWIDLRSPAGPAC